MKNYEVTFITIEDLKEAPIKDALGDDGKILKTQSLGEKQFAYKIEKQTRGFYTSSVISIDPEILPAFNKKLSSDDNVIRFLITIHKEQETAIAKPKEVLPEVVEDKPKKVIEKIVEEKKVKEEIKEEKPEIKEIIKPVVKKEVKKEVAPKVKEEKITSQNVKDIKEVTATEEDRLKALDKKLDELLKD